MGSLVSLPAGCSSVSRAHDLLRLPHEPFAAAEGPDMNRQRAKPEWTGRVDSELERVRLPETHAVGQLPGRAEFPAHLADPALQDGRALLPAQAVNQLGNHAVCLDGDQRTVLLSHARSVGE